MHCDLVSCGGCLTVQTRASIAIDIASYQEHIAFACRGNGRLGTYIEDARARRLRRSRKPSANLAVMLAVTTGQVWRGWMGIEPTQDASTAPRKRF